MQKASSSLRESATAFRPSWQLAAGSAKSLVAAFLLGSAAPALAQESVAEPSIVDDAAARQASESAVAAPPGAAAELEEVVVTGSRITRNGYDTPTPVTVVGEEDLQSSGRSNVADFVNELPSISGSSSPATSNRSLSSGAAGISSVNLRGLGNARTLVLLDGRRSVGSLASGTVDVNTFPQGLIKSVEIVTGGASSVYGSDAVSGVVNFILDKNYTGLKGSVEAGETTYGDDRSWTATLTGGTPFAEGRGHFLFNGELSRRDGIYGMPRDWADDAWHMVDNPGYAAGNGRPEYSIARHSGLNVLTPGGIITSGTQRGTYFGVDGVVNQFAYGDVGKNWTVGGDWEQGQSYDRTSLEPESDRDGLFSRVSFALTDNLNVFGEAGWNKNVSRQWGGEQTDKANVVIKADNAFIPADVAAALAAAGEKQFNLGTSNADIPTRIADNEREVQRYVLGFDGSFDLFDNPWKWDSYYQKGITNTDESLVTTNTARLAFAQDAVLVDGQIVCRGVRDGVAAAAGCVPFNRMGVGVNDAAALDYFMGEPAREQKFEQDVAALNFSTNVANAWVDPIGVAFGVEHRREKISGHVDEQYQSGWAFGNFLPTFGDYDVTEGYLELLVPLPAGFEFNGAARGTDYSVSGYVTTWKAGLTWSPIDDLKLRATQSRDIRAPNLEELYQAGRRRSNSLSDPFYGGEATRFTETTTGNLDLQPEKADTLGLGLIYKPSFVRGLGLSVDYYDIEIDDAINTIVAQDIVDRCYAGNETFCAAFTRDASSQTGRDLIITNSPFNFVQERARGLDLEASYTLPLASLSENWAGTLTLRALGTHFLEMSSNNGVDPETDRAGQNTAGGPPDWRYRLSATYSVDRFTTMLTARGLSSGTYDNSYIECSTDCPATSPLAHTIDNNKIAGAFYIDTYFAYNFDVGNVKNQVYFKVMNLFNEDPEVVGLGPGDSSNVEPGINRALYDYLGRTFRLGLRFEWGA